MCASTWCIFLHIWGKASTDKHPRPFSREGGLFRESRLRCYVFNTMRSHGIFFVLGYPETQYKPNKFRNYEESNLIGYGRAGSLDVVIV